MVVCMHDVYVVEHLYNCFIPSPPFCLLSVLPVLHCPAEAPLPFMMECWDVVLVLCAARSYCNPHDPCQNTE
jgi:hypothetical protein